MTRRPCGGRELAGSRWHWPLVVRRVSEHHHRVEPWVPWRDPWVRGTAVVVVAVVALDAAWRCLGVAGVVAETATVTLLYWAGLWRIGRPPRRR